MGCVRTSAPQSRGSGALRGPQGGQRCKCRALCLPRLRAQSQRRNVVERVRVHPLRRGSCAGTKIVEGASNRTHPRRPCAAGRVPRGAAGSAAWRAHCRAGRPHRLRRSVHTARSRYPRALSWLRALIISGWLPSLASCLKPQSAPHQEGHPSPESEKWSQERTVRAGLVITESPCFACLPTHLAD